MTDLKLTQADIKYHACDAGKKQYTRIVGEYGGQVYSQKFPKEGEDRTNEMKRAILGRFRRKLGITA